MIYHVPHDYLQSECQRGILFIQLFLYEFHYFSIITSSHGTLTRIHNTHTQPVNHMAQTFGLDTSNHLPPANGWADWYGQESELELESESECDAKQLASTQSLPPPHVAHSAPVGQHSPLP